MELAATLLDHVRQSTRVLLTGPEGPDGDSIGACLALQIALRQLAPGVRVEVAGSPGFRYAFLPGAAGMIPDATVGAFDGVVVLDGDKKRLPGPVDTAFRAARWTGIIDHHRSTDPAGYTWAMFDGACESTCVMVRELLRAWNIALTPELGALLYCGLIFDTGAFRYSNTRPSSHLLAAELLATGFDHTTLTLKVLSERRRSGFLLLGQMMSGTRFLAGGRVALTVFAKAEAAKVGADEADVEGIIDVLQNTAGVEMSVVVVERGPDKVKLSLRSHGAVDVAVLAKRLNPNGGGHAKAAGTLVPLGLDAALAYLEPIIVAAVDGG